MSELLSKLSSYNILNNLLPGVIFCTLLPTITEYSISNQDLLTLGFIYYFVGLTISRVSSITIEPLLKKFGFVKFVSYSSYNEALSKNPKLDILSETNNTYRSIIAVCFSLCMAKIYEIVATKCAISHQTDMALLIIVLSILFLYSYKKQTKYIVDNINSILGEKK